MSPISVSDVPPDTVDDRCDACSLELVKNVATLVRRRPKLSLTPLLGRDDSEGGWNGCENCGICCPGEAMLTDDKDGGGEGDGRCCGGVGPNEAADDFGPYFSRRRLISRRRFLQALTCSPPLRLCQTMEKTDALSATSRMNPGSALSEIIFVSDAGDISGKPGLLITWTL